MSSVNILNVESMLRLRPDEMIPAENHPAPAPPDLAILADSSPIQLLVEESDRLLQTLSDQLEISQEAFLDTLRAALHADALHPRERLHLYLAETGALVVEGDDADTAMLAGVLETHPDLCARFKQMAGMALLAHGIEVATRAARAITDTDSDEATPAAQMLGHYHMCLQGSLSHCYVC